MSETASIVWADGPSSMPYEPAKSRIRAWGSWIEANLSILGTAVTAVYVRGTKAGLDAVVGATNDEVGVVVADDTEALRGVYVRSGSAWVKKSDLPVDAALLLVEQAEAARDLALDYSLDAIAAKVAAEAARNIAAGYASDAVSQGNVPIYTTVAGMGAVSVPQGIVSARVNGFTTAGDGGGGLYVRAPAQPNGEYAGLAFRSSDRFLPDGSTSSSNGGWWEWKEKFDMRQAPQKIAARLGRGDRTVIACYGDSTTDGNNTSNWTNNPRDSNNEALGDTDHNLAAPNAWPLRAASVLSAHFAAENYKIMNCGYSGRRMNDGWARRNFMTAVYNNCVLFASGAPYAVIIGFGANDILDSATDAAWLDKHINETRLVCRLAMSLGVIPILVTCDPMWRSDPAGYDSYKSIEMVDTAKAAVAAELGIALIDVGADLKNWMAKNKDLHNVFENQSDALHGGDIWHAFKGSAIARYFMRNFIERVDGRGPQRISNSDPAYRNVLGQAQIYQIKQSRDGAVYTTGRSSAVLADGLAGDVWVWNEDPDAELIYRGVANENYESSDLSYAKPKHVIRDFTNITVKASRVPSGVAFSSSGHGARADSPYRVGKLAYGMNRVQHVVGDAPYYFIGHYEIRSTGEWRREKYGVDASAYGYAISVNALKDQGRMLVEFDRTKPGSSVVFMPEAADLSNVVGLMDGDRAHLNIRAVIPQACGVVLGWVPSYLNRLGDRDNKSFLMLYKSAANTIQIHIGSVNNGVVTATQLASGTIAQSPDADGAEKYLFYLYRSGDTMRLTLYEGWDFPAASIIDYTGAAGSLTVPSAFVMGGFFANLPSGGSGFHNPKILDYFGKQQTQTPGVPEPALVAP